MYFLNYINKNIHKTINVSRIIYYPFIYTIVNIYQFTIRTWNFWD